MRKAIQISESTTVPLFAIIGAFVFSGMTIATIIVYVLTRFGGLDQAVAVHGFRIDKHSQLINEFIKSQEDANKTVIQDLTEIKTTQKFIMQNMRK